MSDFTKYIVKSIIFSSFVLLSYLRPLLTRILFPERGFLIGVAFAFLDIIALGGLIGLRYGIKAWRLYLYSHDESQRRLTIFVLVFAVIASVLALPQLLTVVLWALWASGVLGPGHL